jgi:hypothetical protein
VRRYFWPRLRVTLMLLILSTEMFILGEIIVRVSWDWVILSKLILFRILLSSWVLRTKKQLFRFLWA